MIEHLISFFEKRIEAKRNHVPKIVLRMKEREPEREEDVKSKAKGMSKEQERQFLSLLSDTVMQCFELRERVILWSDYEPQGTLRDVAEKANLSPKDFASLTMLPTKLHIEITKESIVIEDGGSTLLYINR